VVGAESNRPLAGARLTRCGQALTEKEFRFPSAGPELWQRSLDQRLRGWMAFPDSKDPDPELWLKQSRRHGREHRRVPGPSRLATTRSGSPYRWLVSQDSVETDLCGRKNKHRLYRIPCAVRFPRLQVSRQAGPNLTQARTRATSRRTGSLGNSSRARTLSHPRGE